MSPHAMDDIDRRLLEIIQARFPLEARPFRALGLQVGLTEAETLARVSAMQEAGLIRRLGPVFDIERLGYTSTLCAAKVAPESVEAVAARINAYPEVTHNYLRTHAFNIWFTLIAPTPERIETILAEVRACAGVAEVLSLPADRRFKLDVRFQIPEAGR